MCNKSLHSNFTKFYGIIFKEHVFSGYQETYRPYCFGSDLINPANGPIQFYPDPPVPYLPFSTVLTPCTHSAQVIYGFSSTEPTNEPTTAVLEKSSRDCGGIKCDRPVTWITTTIDYKTLHRLRYRQNKISKKKPYKSKRKPKLHYLTKEAVNDIDGMYHIVANTHISTLSNPNVIAKKSFVKATSWWYPKKKPRIRSTHSPDVLPITATENIDKALNNPDSLQRVSNEDDVELKDDKCKNNKCMASSTVTTMRSYKSIPMVNYEDFESANSDESSSGYLSYSA